ncbi:MAG: hypothetical protein IBX48_00365 [Thiomicrospira sp.]|uniref:hypothetical protein n=1 Tax=Thiomicrospira sp. TaxID=935 RepID=UPI0019E2A9B6|nr:hypothetical protein [Thiomicrospira sp.]MBE0492772.1 hypothetical protein [Thiomicrospira sp.]
MRFIVSLFALLMLSGCALTQTGSNSWITFNDQTPATKVLAQALENQGYITTVLNERQIEVLYDNGRYIMEPRIRLGGLSRVVVSQVYPIKTEHQTNPEIFVTLSHLNSHLSCAKYILQPGNKAAEVQSSITFIDDRLSMREVELFMGWMQQRIRQASSLVPQDTLRMFEF